MNRVLLVLPFVFATAAFAAEVPGTKETVPESVQTLDAITIEGDVVVPQVLFITSRDHPRHHEDLGGSLRPTALAVARRAPMPDRLLTLSDCVTASIKEQ